MFPNFIGKQPIHYVKYNFYSHTSSVMATKCSDIRMHNMNSSYKLHPKIQCKFRPASHKGSLMACNKTRYNRATEKGFQRSYYVL